MLDTPKHDIMELFPSNTPEYMAPAWAGLIHFALGKDDILAEFRKQTGERWEPGRTPIDRMIDEATGADWSFLSRFVLWANENLWGDPFAPDEDDDA